MTERLYVMLHGGVNYADEPFAWRCKSLAAAKAEWRRRAHHGGWLQCHDFVNGGKAYYLCWGQGIPAGDHVASAWYLPDDHPAVDQRQILPWLADTTDLYPDRVLVMGPRNGLRWERT